MFDHHHTAPGVLFNEDLYIVAFGRIMSEPEIAWQMPLAFQKCACCRDQQYIENLNAVYRYVYRSRLGTMIPLDQSTARTGAGKPSVFGNFMNL